MNKNITKALARDKERVIQAALREVMEEYPHVIELDEDKGEAYFEVYTDSGYKTMATNYTLNADMTKATVSEWRVVTPMTEYKNVDEDSVVTKVLAGIKKMFVQEEGAPIFKALDDEQMIAIEPLYIEPDGIDGHGWTASGEVLRAMTESCDKAIKEGRLLAKYDHGEVTNDFHFIKAFTMECDCYIGEHFVPEGQPMIKSQFTDLDAWEKRKTGGLGGVSIGAKGIWEEIE